MTVLVLNQVYDQIIEAVEYAKQNYGQKTAKGLGEQLFKLLKAAAVLPGATLPGLPPQHYRISAKRYPYILLCRRNKAKDLTVIYLLWHDRRPLPSADELDNLADEAESTGHPYQS